MSRKESVAVLTREEIQKYWQLAEVSKDDCAHVDPNSSWRVIDGGMDKAAALLYHDGTLVVSVDGTSDLPEVVSDAMSGAFSRLIFPWMWVLLLHWSFKKHGLRLAAALEEAFDLTKVKRVKLPSHSRGVDLAEVMADHLGKKYKFEDKPEVIGFGGAVLWTRRGYRYINKARTYIMHRIFSKADPVPKINLGGKRFRFYHFSTVQYIFDNLKGAFDHTNYADVVKKCKFIIKTGGNCEGI